MKLYFLGVATVVAVCVGCSSADHREHFAPPSEMLTRPGPMVDGPGPGVLAMMGGPPQRPFASTTSQVRFIGPEGMGIGWQIGQGFAEHQLIAPAVYDFPQAATYRLKIQGIPGRDGTVLYPTLQVYPSHPQTDSYLMHNTVPIQITDEDLDQVESNNFVTKVVYLPSPKHQDLVVAPAETLVSTRLDPGVDPVAEADRRGTILAVLRIGNMNPEMPRMSAIPGGIQQTSHIKTVDGTQGAYVAPMPIGFGPNGKGNIPPAMMMSGLGRPGSHPNTTWGQPMTATPIGLPGPPHLPLGGPAGLKSHTIRNRTRMDIPKPVDHLVIDVKHEPGISVPEPVRHIEYKERHFPDE